MKALPKNTRTVPQAPASEPKRKNAKRIIAAPALPDPNSPNAKALINAMFPRVMHPVTLLCSDPEVIEAAREQLALAEEIKELEAAREVQSNILKLAVRGNEGLQLAEYRVMWADARGDTDYRAIFAAIMAAHPETVGTIQAMMAEVETHASIERGRFRKAGSRRLTVKRGEG